MYNPTQTITLKGQWLQELGFEIIHPITVKCEEGKMTITLSNEIFDE